MSKLVIVESPNKISSISKYLGSKYKVMASVGHIVYLPSSGEEQFGVDMESWTPNYKIDPKKQDVVSKLRKAAKDADEVLIATDPDREGEAIGDNIVEFLKLSKKYKRIKFNEITKNAVESAISNPTMIDEKLVQSQIARRILDRIIGYKLSKLMKTKINNSPITPSAGRVQSIALKLVVDREELIEKFVPVKYFTIDAKISDDILAALDSGDYEGNKTWIDPKEIEDYRKDLQGALKVIDVKISERNDGRKTPFKQAILYKRADSVLGISSSSVQRAAQRLYEGYGDGGLISYPRTDSTRMSETFVKSAKDYISNKFGSEYVTDSIKGTAGAQDAHEAIRPTSLDMTPEKAKTLFNLQSAEEKVYRLIYNNTIQSLMKTPRREIYRYYLEENKRTFRLSSSKVIFDGYLKVTGYEKSRELPKYEKNEIIPVKDYIVEEKETQPPARYNDGSLIEKLDNIGVGRPSTFATTINILKKRMYVESEGRSLKATDFGKLVWTKLKKSFPDIMNEKYTADMELRLDQVADGDVDYKKLLDDFWKYFQKEVLTATQELDITKLSNVPAGKECPKCGSELIIKINRRDYSKFYACSNFPECRYTESAPGQKKKFFRKWKKK